MPENPARRLLLRATTLVLGAVLLAGCGGGGSAAEKASPTPSDQPTAKTQDEFCESFLTLVDADAEFGSQLDAVSGRALVGAAGTLLEMPDPVGMSPGARASLDELVAGTLAQLSSVPEVEVDVTPDPANDAEADPTAFDLYLSEACPA